MCSGKSAPWKKILSSVCTGSLNGKWLAGACAGVRAKRPASLRSGQQITFLRLPGRSDRLRRNWKMSCMQMGNLPLQCSRYFENPSGAFGCHVPEPVWEKGDCGILEAFQTMNEG